MNLQDGMTLYHGSYTPIETIDLAKCSAGKDFGRGFYLTSDYEQARKFISTSLKKAQQTGAVSEEQTHGFVSAFCFHMPDAPLQVCSFPTADRQWLWFVSANRRAGLAQQFASRLDPALKTADVVIGKVANDATNPVITAYLGGLYGPLESQAAADTAISLLLPDRLKNQFCFLTERSVNCLEPLEVVRHES
ncbi:MAG: DUF3990 domain-containing protein [Adlercreutzia sp.]|nr:DUF3990 domain-containing protein [Adlercreutzia sp.]